MAVAVPPAEDITALHGATLQILESALAPGEWSGYEHEILADPDALSAAKALVERWKKVVGLRAGSPEAFEKRLAALSLAEDDAYRRFLPRRLIAGALPDWALFIDAVFETSRAECASALEWLGEETTEERAIFGLDRSPGLRFSKLLAPFLVQFRALLTRRATPQFTSDALASIARSLFRRLSAMCGRTVAHRLRVERESGGLMSDTPEARYREFVERNLASAEARTRILGEHPVLARILATVCLHFAEAAVEVIKRFGEDRCAIEGMLGLESGAARIALCFAGLSDMHNGGRSAWILQFEGGARVVYKPRSHDSDLAWAQIVRWLDPACANWKTPRLVARPGYGWSEFIAPRECESLAEAALYYRRQGYNAALIYFLCGQDFHAENFIACGEFPVVVDVEGLLSPTVANPPESLAGFPSSLLPLQFTVANTLCVPYFRGGDRNRPLYIASGIAGTADRLWPVKTPRWQDAGTDLFRLEYGYEDIRFDASVPRCAGEPVPVRDYLGEIEAGFRECRHMLIHHSGELFRDHRTGQSLWQRPGFNQSSWQRPGFNQSSSPSHERAGAGDAPAEVPSDLAETRPGDSGPLDCLRSLEGRLLFRDTQDYENLLFWTTAPDILESGAAYDVALEMLAGAVPVFFTGASFPELIDEEKKCLWRRDIPIAMASASGTAITLPSGREFGPIVPVAMWEQMKTRIRSATPEDLERQCALLRSLFEISFESAVGAVVRRSNNERPLDLPLDCAIAIGEDLDRTAVRHGGHTGWLELGRFTGGAARVYPVPSEPWSLNGDAGNALFLINLARTTGQARFERTGRAALDSATATLRAVMKGPWRNSIGISGFFGYFGLVYALAAAGVQLGDKGLIAESVRMALDFPRERPAAETNPDFLTGAAGPVAILSWLHGLTGDARLLEPAREMAGAIARCARNGGRQGWQAPFFKRPLLGMAHGSAGISMALLRLYRESGDSALFTAALSGLAHERDHFRMQDGQWPNLQEEPGRISYMTGWCAGAAGIGLGRLDSIKTITFDSGDYPHCGFDIDAAIAATRENSGGSQHHMCCGEAGRIAFFAAAASALDRPDLHEEAVRAAGGMMDYFKRQNLWNLQEFCEKLSIPGIMAGVPGIGLSFLRLVRGGVSKVLTLC